MEKTLVSSSPTAWKLSVSAKSSLALKERFNIVDCKLAQLSAGVLEEHYSHIRQLEHVFPMLVEFMSSRPVLVMILEGENVISRVRELLGPTDPAEAAEGTIRGDFGVDKTKNVVHASDSPESAEIEINRFFGA